MKAPGTLEEAIAAVTQLTRSIVADEAPGVDRDARWPEAAIRALQAAGLGGLMVPRELGGLGQGLKGLLLVCEELGRVCPSTALAFGMHCVGTATIASRATPAQQETYLRPIAAGKHLTTLALSEPGTGAHFYFPQTKAQRTPEGDYVLQGTKSFVTNGGHADSYVVSVVQDAQGAAEPVGAFSCVVVPHDSDGLRWASEWKGFGMRGNASCTLEISKSVIDESNLLGREGDQLWYLFNVVTPYFLVAMAGTYLGIASGAFEETLNHVKRRFYSHSGTSLADASVVQHHVGELYGLLESTRCLALHAARQIDRGVEQDLAAILSSKAQVAESAVKIVNDCMTLMGGAGYAANGPMQQRLRDVRAAHVMSPTTDILRIWTGRALLDVPLLKE